MPVSDLVQTFTGITNENEFYSHHYLSEVFRGDIRTRLEQWKDAEETNGTPSPQTRLRACSRLWRQRLVEVHQLSSRQRADEVIEAIEKHRVLHRELLEALGYSL